MNENLVNIGFKNVISANKLVAIVKPGSAPIKKIIREARDRGMLIDTTYKRRTKAVIITNNDIVILSAIQPKTIAYRLSATDVKCLEEVKEIAKTIYPPNHTT